MRLGPVDHAGLVEWIIAIPLEGWPQQHRLDGQIRPAMVTDLGWHDFARRTDQTVWGIMHAHFGDYLAYQRMLSVMMPGHSIPPHIDEQGKNWICRVHVPLTSNDRSFFIVEGQPQYFDPGFAYRVDTTKEHAVTNDGDTPRIHFMFDVGKSC